MVQTQANIVRKTFMTFIKLVKEIERYNVVASNKMLEYISFSIDGNVDQSSVDL